MSVSLRTMFSSEAGIGVRSFKSSRFFDGLAGIMACLFALALTGTGAAAQVNVLTGHNDIARTGQNLNETILTPSNVNSNQFGKLSTQSTDGGILAQPLYVSQVAIPSNGT